MAANIEQETAGNDQKAEEQKAGTDSLRLGVHCTKDDRVKVSVIPPSLPTNSKRLPAIVCCVVDVSGSMGSEATIKDASGNIESDGLTILDLVKHSIKTIIHCLNESDYLSIVTYSSKATVITQLLQMTEQNKKRTLTALDNLRASGQTNLWDGLFNGLEILRKNKEIECSHSNSAVLLFTDGLPNVIPPKGHMGMLDKYIDTNQELVGIINTYGFGYSLDTKLLNDLAIKGNGAYAFIPDSSFVGTIFVNSISNFCSNVAKNCVVKIETSDAYNVEVIGGYDCLQTSWGVQVHLGNIMYGQNKDILLKFTRNNNSNENESNTIDDEGKEGVNGNNDNNKNMYEIEVNSLNYISLRQNKLITAALTVIDDDKNGVLTEMSYFRLLACDVLRQCMKSMRMNDMSDAQNALKELIKSVSSHPQIANEKFVIGLLEDLSGQAFESISKAEYWSKWGKHYLPSLVFAHLHQYNNNFKDPGVQNYGGQCFEALRDTANDIFIKLPPPKPSKPKYTYTNANKGKGKGKGKKKAKAVDMRNYYNVSGGCFGGECDVRMSDGSSKMVRDLCVNDVVCGGNVIVCVVKHKCEANEIRMCGFDNGLWVTEYHPIRSAESGEWVFPCEVVESRVVSGVEFVYNFVLDSGHLMEVNGVQCCTLGHGFKGSAVIEHQYFGTERVVKDLQRLSGWHSGCVVLDGASAFKRNANDNLVCGMVE